MIALTIRREGTLFFKEPHLVKKTPFVFQPRSLRWPGDVVPASYLYPIRVCSCQINGYLCAFDPRHPIFNHVHNDLGILLA